MKRLALTLMTLAAASTLMADEGMWMPQQTPKVAARMKAAGMRIDPKRLEDLTGDPMGAVISLGGCTASFVSADGLVVTNHHCAFGALQNNSTPQRDLITDGFVSHSRDEELPAGESQRVYVTTKIEDVTARMMAVDPKLGDAEYDRAMARKGKELVAECEKPGGLRCRVVSMYEGSQFLRMTQMEIQDVRLVYAPPNSVGDFGGDIDNFEWPRHTGDFSFLRAYVGKDGKPAPYAKDNVPYHPAHHLEISTKGIDPGDFVLVIGYPGRTFRYKTAAEVKYYQDFLYPTSVRYLDDLDKILEAAGKGNRDIQLHNAARIKGNANTLKNYQSTVEGFRKDHILEARQRREAALRAALAKPGAASSTAYVAALDELAALDAKMYATQERDLMIGYLPRSSPMLGQALAAARLASERTKADLDRTAGYQERDLVTLRNSSDRASRTIEPASDRAGLRYFLVEASKLPPSQRLKGLDDLLAATGATGTEAQIDKLLDQTYATTKVTAKDERTKMLGETAAQLAARNDGMLTLAYALLPDVQALAAREEAQNGAMARVRPRYFAALESMSPDTLYPDANLTLRFTFGNVKGYAPKDATSYAPQTKLAGVLEKETGHDPFDSPKRLLDAANDPAKRKPYVDAGLGDVPVDFLSTVDTTGGNSGSPTLDADGKLCGLLFDGNYESIDADFLYTPSITRSIHVDAQYMLWVLDAVDSAQSLIREMGLTPKVAK